MATQHMAPYGAWKSPITSDLIVSQSIGLGGGTFDGDDVYWLEGRPAEAGRNVIVRRAPDGGTEDVNTAPFNARTRVHEYGGGAVLVDRGIVIFSNFADQRLYRVVPGQTPEAITPEAPLRYADCVVDAARNRLICVREDHGEAAVAHGEAVNTIAALALDGSETQHVLVSGNDFYATPRLSPDGNTLAWLAWRHPNMPWDGTELWIAEVQPDGSLANAALIAGGENESIFQPSWSPDGRLYFVSDRSGWWNLYRLDNEGIERLVAMEAEFGVPQWAFGFSAYAFDSAERIICTYTKTASTIWQAWTPNIKRSPRWISPTPASATSRSRQERSCFAARRPRKPPRWWSLTSPRDSRQFSNAPTPSRSRPVISPRRSPSNFPLPAR